MRSKEWVEVQENFIKQDPILALLCTVREEAEKEGRTQRMTEANDAIRAYLLRSCQDTTTLGNLTPGQSGVLDIIVQSFKSTGMSPTTREIADEMGWRSTTSAVKAVGFLLKKGYLHKVPGQWRSLIPLYDSSRHRVRQPRQ